jgi:hypothetical protein
MRGEPSRGEESAGRRDDGVDLTRYRGTSPRDLMGRLLDGDPLGLQALGVTRRDELAYLISSDRMYLRAAARVAYGACIYGTTKPLDAWLLGCIDAGIEGILRDETAEHRDGVPVEEDEERYYHAVMDLLDVSVEDARGVCITFNALPYESRAAYFKFSLERTSLEQTRDASDEGQSLRDDLAGALRALLRDGGRR